MRKIGELKNVMEKIEAIHQEEMAEKACELDLCERQDANISKRSTDIHPKFDEIAAETEQENSKIEALKTGLKEAQQIINNVESTAASTAQLTSEIEVQNDAWKKLQNTAEMAQIEMQTSLTRIEQLKMDRKVAETQNTILNQRLDEIFYLVSFFTVSCDIPGHLTYYIVPVTDGFRQAKDWSQRNGRRPCFQARSHGTSVFL